MRDLFTESRYYAGSRYNSQLVEHSETDRQKIAVVKSCAAMCMRVRLKAVIDSMKTDIYILLSVNEGGTTNINVPRSMKPCCEGRFYFFREQKPLPQIKEKQEG